MPFLVSAVLPALSGCNTAETRAREKVAAFGLLPPADQTLVLGGQVRTGLPRDAVDIAWGTPSEVRPPDQGDGQLETWLWTRTFYGPGGGYYGIPRGQVWSPKLRRYHYDGDDYYETPVYLRPFGQVSTDLPFHRALFDRHRLVSFEGLPDDSRLTAARQRNPR